MTRNELIERMLQNHRPGSEPRMVIEQCVDVAMDVINGLERTNGDLRSSLSSVEIATSMWRARAEAAEERLADRERDQDNAVTAEEDADHRASAAERMLARSAELLAELGSANAELVRCIEDLGGENPPPWVAALCRMSEVIRIMTERGER